jgi:hypothetical protein
MFLPHSKLLQKSHDEGYAEYTVHSLLLTFTLPQDDDDSSVGVCDGGTTQMIINFIDKISKYCTIAMFVITDIYYPT